MISHFESTKTFPIFFFRLFRDLDKLHFNDMISANKYILLRRYVLPINVIHKRVNTLLPFGNMVFMIRISLIAISSCFQFPIHDLFLQKQIMDGICKKEEEEVWKEEEEERCHVNCSLPLIPMSVNSCLLNA